MFLSRECFVSSVDGRGFDFPGGHIEKGETPEEAFHREAFEEGYVRGHINYIGAIEVSHEENPLYNVESRYPFIGYRMFYHMEILEYSRSKFLM